MLTVNYITRPFFMDIALELIQELKNKCTLNVIMIISPWNIDYLDINDEDANWQRGQPLNKVADKLPNKLYVKYGSYLNGCNLIIKCEEPKETSLKNAIGWKILFSAHASVREANLNIIESLSFADWYLLFKIRNKKNYYIVHDPLPHTGEGRKRTELIKDVLFKNTEKFLLYSSYSTRLFKQNFPAYSNKTITLKTPVYSILKRDPKEKSTDKKKVLFFGRISPYKGVELFYAAAEQLSKEFNDITFIIAGKCQNNYSPAFLDNNPYQNIHIINKFIDQDTLAGLMTNAAFCVLPYLDATQSGVIMTCYAYDLPVLVSDCEGLLEYNFDKNNFSFVNGDINDLKTKMRNLLKNDNILSTYKKSINSYTHLNVSEQNVNTILEHYNVS
jgi:glycosyltransferase involved in cell wall biosynthesis